jgi:hypothetical protein
MPTKSDKVKYGFMFFFFCLVFSEFDMAIDDMMNVLEMYTHVIHEQMVLFELTDWRNNIVPVKISS